MSRSVPTWKPLVDHGQRPAAVVQPFGCLDVCWLAEIAGFGASAVDRDDHDPTAVFDPTSAVPLVAQIVLEAGEQQRSKAPSRGVDTAKEVALRAVSEEPLGQVLGLLGGVALAPDVGVKGVPARPAQLGQGRPRLRGAGVARGGDVLPARRLEPRGRRFSASVAHGHPAFPGRSRPARRRSRSRAPFQERGRVVTC